MVDKVDAQLWQLPYYSHQLPPLSAFIAREVLHRHRHCEVMCISEHPHQLLPFHNANTPMPWKACGVSIRHVDGELQPRAAVIYRCHICRLELVTDLKIGTMVLAPLPDPPLRQTKPPRSHSNRNQLGRRSAELSC